VPHRLERPRLDVFRFSFGKVNDAAAILAHTDFLFRIIHRVLAQFGCLCCSGASTADSTIALFITSSPERSCRLKRFVQLLAAPTLERTIYRLVVRTHYFTPYRSHGFEGAHVPPGILACSRWAATTVRLDSIARFSRTWHHQ
jgi:hypothetical protein